MPRVSLFGLPALSALLLFAIWPFTRLVHMLTAPVGYLTRLYVVYRSRDEHRAGARDPRRGREPTSRRTKLRPAQQGGAPAGRPSPGRGT
ncbi:respiratory nitrate reductase subunit gamma [Streptosporangium roseum]|uniref:respiratory nitrate reductase subunit gamma n=1 Tax=Streptosporangium roseum TaxID=2001 RepID=UPI0002D8C2E7